MRRDAFPAVERATERVERSDSVSICDLRHTGITWRAQRGDEPLKIQRAAGHDDLRTTQRYINEAQTFEGTRFGEPFPSIPLSALTNFGVNIGFLAGQGALPPYFPRTEERPQGDSKSATAIREN